MGVKQPFECKVEGEELVIRIGIGVLAYAAENSPAFLCNSEWPRYRVHNPDVFAEEVLRQIEHENEIGASRLEDFLDDMFQRALDDGCDGVERVPDEHPPI